MTRFLACALVLFSLCTAASSQNIHFTATVGVPMSVPSLIAGDPSGQVDLTGLWFDSSTAGGPRAVFEITCIPSGWAGHQTPEEQMLFILDRGSSATPGIMLHGGTLYLPLHHPLILDAQPAHFIGPGDTIPATDWMGSGFPCPLPGNRRGSSLILVNPLSANLVGHAFTMQGALWDRATHTLYTSNALNFSIIP